MTAATVAAGPVTNFAVSGSDASGRAITMNWIGSGTGTFSIGTANVVVNGQVSTLVTGSGSGTVTVSTFTSASGGSTLAGTFSFTTGNGRTVSGGSFNLQY